MRLFTPLISLSLMLAFSTLPAAGLPPDAAPPLPSLAEREAFVAAHRTTPPPVAARDVHDEYDVLHYDDSLDLDIDAEEITGTVVMDIEAAIDGLSALDLDFFAPMVVDDVRVNGANSAFSHIYHTLSVELDASYQTGESFQITCDYHGTPYYSLAPFRWEQHAGVPMILSYSEPYGAPAWWVCKDDPKDKATFGIHVTAPDDLYTVSNGVLENIEDHGNGRATFNWRTDYPMSTYLFSIAVTNYATWTEIYTALDGETTMDVDYFAYPEHLTSAQTCWGRNVEMMEYYAGVFGEYPFLAEKYAIAEFQRTGAMEHQTATSWSYSYIVPSQYYDWIVAHELSHSWVGDMITMTEWSHAWCKEGFATFCEAIYFEDKYGTDYYHDYMNSMAPLTYGAYQIFGISPPLHSAIYYKGAWVLHMLRHVLGDDDFFQGIYDYSNDPDFRYGVADTEDLRGAFEAASGMDLTWFFDQWIYHPGYPVYDLRWEAQEAGGGGYDVDLVISQHQSAGPIFTMPIDIAVEFGFGEERFVVWDSLPVQDFTLHVSQSPVDLVLDPDDWIIKEASVATTAGGQPATALRLLPNHPNPFNPTTEIRFDLPRAGRVDLGIFDLEGRRLRTLVAGVREAGEQSVRWDGRDDAGRELSSGVYCCRLAGAEGHRVRKLTLIR